MGLIEDIEAEVGPLGGPERQMVEQELDLLASFAKRLVGRLPHGATEEDKQAAITELLHEDPELFAVFSELLEVSRSNPASPMRSVHRLERELERSDGDSPSAPPH